MLSPINPTSQTANPLVKKLMVIKIPFIKEGRWDLLSLIIANKIGVVPKIKSPSKRSIANDRTPVLKTNIQVKTGETTAIIKRVFLLPSLSDIVPDKNEPAAPVI